MNPPLPCPRRRQRPERRRRSGPSPTPSISALPSIRHSRSPSRGWRDRRSPRQNPDRTFDAAASNRRNGRIDRGIARTWRGVDDGGDERCRRRTRSAARRQSRTVPSSIRPGPILPRGDRRRRTRTLPPTSSSPPQYHPTLRSGPPTPYIRREYRIPPRGTSGPIPIPSSVSIPSPHSSRTVRWTRRRASSVPAASGGISARPNGGSTSDSRAST
mmetsp:Transcript_36239/g.108640  ORF Transcript_36239/g.108640 Transcript_36239/m.108640 type:complete len:215 (+) Transcript_36239:1243-1887(+)